MTITYVLKGLGYEATEADSCLFVKTILLYVDDMLIATKDDTEYRSVRKHQERRFKITYVSNVKQYFGIPFERQENGGFLLCKEHIPKDLGYVTAEQKEEKVVATTEKHQSLYVSVCIRPDPAITTSILKRKVSRPMESEPSVVILEGNRWTEAAARMSCWSSRSRATLTPIGLVVTSTGSRIPVSC